jgi:hypothetical protein
MSQSFFPNRLTSNRCSLQLEVLETRYALSAVHGWSPPVSPPAPFTAANGTDHLPPAQRVSTNDGKHVVDHSTEPLGKSVRGEIGEARKLAADILKPFAAKGQAHFDIRTKKTPNHHEVEPEATNETPTGDAEPLETNATAVVNTDDALLEQALVLIIDDVSVPSAVDTTDLRDPRREVDRLAEVLAGAAVGQTTDTNHVPPAVAAPGQFGTNTVPLRDGTVTVRLEVKSDSAPAGQMASLPVNSSGSQAVRLFGSSEGEAENKAAAFASLIRAATVAPNNNGNQTPIAWTVPVLSLESLGQIVDAAPFDAALLERAMHQFLDQVDGLPEVVGNWLDDPEVWTWLFLGTAVVAAGAEFVRRRRGRNQTPRLGNYIMKSPLDRPRAAVPRGPAARG